MELAASVTEALASDVSVSKCTVPRVLTVVVARITPAWSTLWPTMVTSP